MATLDDRPRTPMGRDLLVIVALTAILIVPSILTRDLRGPDEPRYSEVARVQDPIESPRVFCQGLQPYVEAGGPLHLYDTEFAGMVNLYLGRVSIPLFEDPDQLRAALRTPGSLVLSDTRHFEKVLTKAEMDESTIYQGYIGGRRMVLLRGARP